MGRRKRTETEKNNSRQEKVEEFSVDKESMLSSFSEISKTTLTQEVIDKFQIKPVERITNMRGKKFRHFNEGTYEKSLNEAYKWMSSLLTKKLDIGETRVELVDYYPQRHKSSSVFVSYNPILEIENEKENV